MRNRTCQAVYCWNVPAVAKKHRYSAERKSHTLPPDNVPPREEHFNLQLAKRMSAIEDKIRSFKRYLFFLKMRLVEYDDSFIQTESSAQGRSQTVSRRYLFQNEIEQSSICLFLFRLPCANNGVRLQTGFGTQMIYSGDPRSRTLALPECLASRWTQSRQLAPHSTETVPPVGKDFHRRPSSDI